MTRKQSVEKNGKQDPGPVLALLRENPIPGELEFEKLVPASYNPRDATDSQIHSICVSIIEFGIVDPFVVRREDNLVIGGHQRQKAIKHLLSGPFKYKGTGEDGKPNVNVVNFELPGGKVPVVFVSGLTEEKTKLLNLALNKATGDWDSDALAKMLGEMSATIPMEEMLFTGFSPAELTDYIDLAGELAGMTPEMGGGFGEGSHPVHTTKAPKLDLDFSSPELRDAVKAAIGAKVEGGEPSGDALARVLGVVASPKVKKKPKL